MKLPVIANGVEQAHVAPFTGAWIEMIYSVFDVSLGFGRTLHGCVD